MSSSVQGSLQPAIVWERAGAIWRVRGHASARALLADPHLDVVPAGESPVFLGNDAAPSAMQFLQSWFSRTPRNHHHAVKRHLYRPYSEQSLALQAELMEKTAAECAAALPVDCDLVQDFLMPFWLRTTAQMLAVPEDQYKLLAKAATALSAILGLEQLDQNAARVVDACVRYLRSLVEHLLAVEKPAPLLHALRDLAADTQVGGTWTVVSSVSQLLAAGLHPTIIGAASAWRALHEQPGLIEEVSAERFSVFDFADEILRLEPPFPFIHRWVHAACDCQSVMLEPGSHVVIDVTAANRDPEAFPEPLVYRPGRNGKLSLSFGHGAHLCIGTALAKMQIGIALRALLRLASPPRPLSLDLHPQKTLSGHLGMVKSFPCRRQQGFVAAACEPSLGTQ